MSELMLDFADISLIPNVVSLISSRDQINTSNYLPDSRLLKFPLIGAPMRDVCNGDSVNKLIELGCLGIIHRFYSLEDQVSEFRKNRLAAAAIGINSDYIERYKVLLSEGCTLFCIDVANGASQSVMKAIESLLKINQKVKFIVGNVASAETFRWAANLPNVVGVRVGIAGGTSCSTKNATGVFCPMASLILACKDVKDKEGIGAAIIADGGIREPQDMCKAISLGADCVMVGSVLAAASDSPAEFIKKDEKVYKLYHGSASLEIQKTYKEVPRYIEGKTTLLEFNNESVEQIVGRFGDGLKSSMSYFNATDIKTYQRNSNWCRVARK